MALGFLLMSMEWFQYIMMNLEVGKIFAFVIKLFLMCNLILTTWYYKSFCMLV